jgi:hypothetical protein
VLRITSKPASFIPFVSLNLESLTCSSFKSLRLNGWFEYRDLLFSVVFQCTKSVPGILHNAFLHLSANLFEIICLNTMLLFWSLFVYLEVSLVLLCKQFLSHLWMPLTETCVLLVNSHLVLNSFNHLAFVEVDLSFLMWFRVEPFAGRFCLVKRAGLVMFKFHHYFN